MSKISKIILFAIIFFAMLSFQRYAESLADNHDLSGVKHPIPVVKQDGMDFTPTVPSSSR